MNLIAELFFAIFTPINLIFLVLTIYLAREDYKSFYTDDYKNYKSLITGLGILGTFVGIFWGLLNFDAKDLDSIQKSIPVLLDGLRTAFLTSIFGMLAAYILTFIQKRSATVIHSEDEAEILRSIDSKLRTFSGINETGKEIISEIKALNSEFNEKNSMLLETLEINFEKVNLNLEKSIKQISEGASKEIVNALKEVIERFNEEISTGFGDNFKELNQAIGKLLIWQNQHGENLKLMQEGLEKAVNSINATDNTLGEIAGKNDQIIEIYQLFSEMIDKYQEQAHQMNTRLMAQIELSEIMKKGIDDANSMMHHFLGEFSAGSMEVSESFKQTTESLKTLTQNIQKELPRSLGSLEHSLVKLSEGFKNDYKTFLDYYKSLVISQE